MKPYSHFAVASQLENDIHPKLVEQYYWGALAPDLRLLAGFSHQRTHLSSEAIFVFLDKYPHLESFIQGYLIHCLTDDVEIGKLLRQRNDLLPYLNTVSTQFIATIIELFYIENYLVHQPLSGDTNAMLMEIGIPDQYIKVEFTILKPYLEKPGLEAIYNYMESGINPRLQNHLEEIESIKNDPLVKPLWFNLADLNRLNQQVVSQIRQSPAFKQICD
jgi:hypothetical protein